MQYVVQYSADKTKLRFLHFRSNSKTTRKMRIISFKKNIMKNIDHILILVTENSFILKWYQITFLKRALKVHSSGCRNII